MKKIMIADDSGTNRDMLSSVFEDQYEITEAENGAVAIEYLEKNPRAYSLILLDLIMPVKTGMDVLDYMKEKKLLNKIPVIMITGESSTETDIRFHEYGVADIIYKPFSRRVVLRRALNIIELFEHREDLETKLEERTQALRQAVEKLHNNNDFLINALSSILELRSVESGLHIRRVQLYTRILIETWLKLHFEEKLSKYDVDLIVRAAAIHDIGKIAIADEILCKPGKLTKEEYEIIKTHTVKGCELLEKFTQEESEFYRYCYDICRYHHERYDGRGYPDGLAGDAIPLWAQIVSLADVYDALVSPRVYKAPYTVDEAYRMIHNGECGEFNPAILECFDTAKREIVAITEESAEES